MNSADGSPNALQDLLVMSPESPSSPLSWPPSPRCKPDSDLDDIRSLPWEPYSPELATRSAAQSSSEADVLVPSMDRTPIAAAASLPIGHTSPLNSGQALPEPTTPAASAFTDPVHLSSSGPIHSSPVVGTRQQRRAIIQRKGTRKHKETLQRKRDERERREVDLASANATYQAAITVHAGEHALGDVQSEGFAAPLGTSTRTREDILDDVLAVLKRHGLTWGDLVLYVSNPASGRGNERYHGMFEIPGRVKQVLTYWVSSYNSPTARQSIHAWVMEYVKRLVGLEGSHATEDGLLQSRKMDIDEGFISNFHLTWIYERLMQLCPTMTELLREFTLTKRQRDTPTKTSLARNEVRVGAALTSLLGERSQNNSYARHVLGLYLYATGAQRQTISVLSRLGVCSSYTTIAGSSRHKDTQGTAERASRHLLESQSDDSESSADSDGLPATGSHVVEGLRAIDIEEPDGSMNSLDAIDTTKPDEACRGDVPCPATSLAGAGLLRRLSESSRFSARMLARNYELGHVYDNINWILRAAEQIMGRKDSIENGTCATVFPLFAAPRADMQTSDFLHSFDTAPPLRPRDIVHQPSENQLLITMLEHNVLRIITSHGGSAFMRFVPDVQNTLPSTADCIALHQTEIYPLRAMNIEEMSVRGNAEVLETIFGELGHDLSSATFTETVKIVFGDQLSVARLRAVINNRAGHDSFSKSLLYAAFAPGLFHYQMAATYAVLETHWGNPSLGPHDPACLSWHNNILDRKPFVLSNRPSYRTACDLIFHSLYGRILHCLELVTGCESLDSYAENVTFGELQTHVAAIVSRFVKPGTAGVSKLRSARTTELGKRGTDSDDRLLLTQGDMVFENACLFLRDALVLREFADAIKSGDSGRVICILKLLALSYRGSGHTKYAQEALFVIHNLEHLWPKPLRAIMINNWLVNTKGQSNHWYPVDLLQEHNIFWTKTIYNASGSGASWDWLEMISPCIDILRSLVTSINEALGSRQGMKHAQPDLTRDIEQLRRSLAEANVYKIQPGRVIDGEKAVVPNVVALGLSLLSGPLAEYNRMLAVLKKRRRRTSPLVEPALGNVTTVPTSTRATPEASSDHSPASSTLDKDSDTHVVDEAREHSEDESSEDEGLLIATAGSWLEPEVFFSLDEEGDVDPYYDY